MTIFINTHAQQIYPHKTENMKSCTSKPQNPLPCISPRRRVILYPFPRCSPVSSRRSRHTPSLFNILVWITFTRGSSFSCRVGDILVLWKGWCCRAVAEDRRVVLIVELEGGFFVEGGS